LRILAPESAVKNALLPFAWSKAHKCELQTLAANLQIGRMPKMDWPLGSAQSLKLLATIVS
jgi:hypothetical protein